MPIRPGHGVLPWRSRPPRPLRGCPARAGQGYPSVAGPRRGQGFSGKALRTAPEPPDFLDLPVFHWHSLLLVGRGALFFELGSLYAIRLCQYFGKPFAALFGLDREKKDPGQNNPHFQLQFAIPLSPRAPEEMQKSKGKIPVYRKEGRYSSQRAGASGQSEESRVKVSGGHFV